MTDGDNSIGKRCALDFSPHLSRNASFSLRAAMLLVSVAIASGCDNASVANEQAPANWTHRADERGRCSFSGTRDVRYGSETHNTVKSLTNGTPCDNGIFGDPAPGELKQCWIAGAPDAASPSASAKAKTASTNDTSDDNGWPMKAPPRANDSQGLRCNKSSDVAAANAQGDLIDADTPGSDGTRLFPLDRSFQIVITTRAPRDDKLAWKVRDAWGTVQASGTYGVAQ